MSQYIDNLIDAHPLIQYRVKEEKTIQNPPEGVGEEWPRLLSKKWLAIHYGCTNGREVLWRRFRSHVLTEEVLKKAGIDPAFAYSSHCRTFNAIDSLMLTKILRGFCLLTLLMISTITQAQTSTQKTADGSAVKYSGDKFVRDTIPGTAMLTDSTIRMVQAKDGFRYEKVLSTIVVDAYAIKEYRFLVRASDGGEEPFDLTQSFHLLTGGLIDPNRILLFKAKSK